MSSPGELDSLLYEVDAVFFDSVVELEPNGIETTSIIGCRKEVGLGKLSSSKTCLAVATEVFGGGIDEEDDEVEIEGDEGKLSSRD